MKTAFLCVFQSVFSGGAIRFILRRWKYINLWRCFFFLFWEMKMKLDFLPCLKLVSLLASVKTFNIFKTKTGKKLWILKLGVYKYFSYVLGKKTKFKRVKSTWIYFIWLVFIFFSAQFVGIMHAACLWWTNKVINNLFIAPNLKLERGENFQMVLGKNLYESYSHFNWTHHVEKSINSSMSEEWKTRKKRRNQSYGKQIPNYELLSL